MCGIWGMKCNYDKMVLELLFGALKLRGPDYSYFEEIKEGFYLGFHRLAIMDGSELGNQPFIKGGKDKPVYSVINGEIYNYKELIAKYGLKPISDSDCEVVPLLYELIGPYELAKELDGEFAIAIIDGEKVYLIRDTFGVRPLFYVGDNDIFGFSSEIKGLLHSDTKIFPPGHVGEMINGGEFKIVSFKDPYPVPGGGKGKGPGVESLDTIQQNIYDKLTKSVISMLINTHRPLGALLSGGLDSSLIVGIASKYLKDNGLPPLSTFSIGMPGSTDKYYAELVSSYCGTNHTHIELTQEDFLNGVEETIIACETYDITTIRASVGQYLVSKWISKNTDIKVLLIGDGSDELTSGYMYFHNAPSSIDSHYENCRLLDEIHLYDVLRADRGVASNGLEARVPFLNKEFVYYYLSINPELRVPINGLEKWLLRSAFFNKDIVPEQVLMRKKEAFSDGVSSLEKSWYVILQENIKTLYHGDWKICPPKTPEASYYRYIYHKYYGNISLINEFWMPKWVGEINEPSARVLGAYGGLNAKE